MKPQDQGLFSNYRLPESPWEYQGVQVLEVQVLHAMVTGVLMELMDHPQDSGAVQVLTEIPGFHGIVSARREEPLPRVVIYCNKFEPEGILWVPPKIVSDSLQRARLLKGIVDP